MTPPSLGPNVPSRLRCICDAITRHRSHKPLSLARSSEDGETRLTPTETHNVPVLGGRVSAGLAAHFLSMEGEHDVSFSPVGEDEDQNPAASEKLAVSSNAPSSGEGHITWLIFSKIVSSVSPAQGEDNP